MASAPEPGVGLGEELADLGVVEEAADLLERAPVIPVAERVGDVLGGAGEVGVVENLGEVVGDGLEDLATSADIGVGEAALEAVAEGPGLEAGLLLELAGGGLE